MSLLLLTAVVDGGHEHVWVILLPEHKRGGRVGELSQTSYTQMENLCHLLVDLLLPLKTWKEKTVGGIFEYSFHTAHTQDTWLQNSMRVSLKSRLFCSQPTVRDPRFDLQSAGAEVQNKLISLNEFQLLSRDTVTPRKITETISFNRLDVKLVPRDNNLLLPPQESIH